MMDTDSPLRGRPKRIQRSWAKGWRMPENAVYVGRPSRWGNEYITGKKAFALPHHPFVAIDTKPPLLIEVRNAAHAAALFRQYWMHLLSTDNPGHRAARAALEELRGRDLACWCPLTYPDGSPHPCHADVLLELANGHALPGRN